MEDTEITLEEKMLERKQKILAFLEHPEYVGMKRKEMVRILEVPEEDRESFEQILKDLEKEGKLLETKKGKLMATKALNMFIGNFISHSKGFGFVSVEEGNDIFIPADSVNGAMHRDKVLCRLVRQASNGKRAEGAVIRVLERGQQQICSKIP